MTVLIGKKAPDFTAKAVMPNNEIVDLNLKEYMGHNITMLFFWPMDFSIICTTEVQALEKNIKAFNERGVRIIGISNNSAEDHIRWKNMPHEEGGIGQVHFPMIADNNKEVSNKYGVLSKDNGPLRATIIIDGNGEIRHEFINDMPLGRNIKEVLQTIDDLKYLKDML